MTLKKIRCELRTQTRFVFWGKIKPKTMKHLSMVPVFYFKGIDLWLGSQVWGFCRFVKIEFVISLMRLQLKLKFVEVFQQIQIELSSNRSKKVKNFKKCRWKTPYSISGICKSCKLFYWLFKGCGYKTNHA